MYHIIICDDDSRFRSYMRRIILDAGLKEKEAVFAEYASGEALADALDICHVPCDLLILDMQMGHMDGDATANAFRRHCPQAILVFCSGVCQPTVQSFRTTPFRYLLKAYTDEKMIAEVKEIIAELKKNKVEPFIIGHYRYSSVRLRPNDILYIEIAKRGSRLHLCPNVIKEEFEKSVTAKERVAELYEVLNEFGFAYAHNSYIVNLKYIKKMISSELVLTNGEKLSVSKSKWKEFRLKFAEYSAEKYR